MLSMIVFLIAFPALAALLISLAPKETLRDWLVKLSAVVIAGISVVCAAGVLKENAFFFPAHTLWADKLIFGLEALLSAYLISLALKHKRPLVVVLIVAQFLTIAFLEFFSGHHLEAEHNLFIDKFSAIMALIIGIIGSIICVFAIGYMKDFQHHHQNQADRRPFFFFLLFAFLSAYYFSLLLGFPLRFFCLYSFG